MTLGTMWDCRFLRVAREVALWSKDPSTKVGAVIVRPDRRIVSTGYNGFPRGVDDDAEVYADRAVKYKRTVHAEMNAILAARESLQGCELFCTFPPCASCSGAIIQVGICCVTWIEPPTEAADRWAEETAQMATMFRQGGVTYSVYPAECVG